MQHAPMAHPESVLRTVGIVACAPALHAGLGAFDSLTVYQFDVAMFRLWASLPRFSCACPPVRVRSSLPQLYGVVRGAGIPGLSFKQDFAGSNPVNATKFGDVA